MDADETLECLRVIVSNCKAAHAGRLMIERDVPMILSTGDVFAVAEAFSHMGVGSLKVAVVDKRPQYLDVIEFGALVTTNRGVDLHAFVDRSVAEEWLLSD